MAQQSFTVGNYLATRLEQIGLKHYFVVPGDYNLMLLDQLLWNKNIQQIGCCNELNASYAAEGYARANGAGAVVVTYNVGVFSALNGIAGAYAENLPVIFISGGYNTNDASANHYLHHTLGTHDFSYQYEMIQKVTCDAVQIFHAEDAPYLIDHAICTALRERKPAYIEIPCNLANLPCTEPQPFESLLLPERSDPKALASAVDAVASLLNDAQKPLLLAGSRLRSYGAIESFRALAEALGCGVAVMPDAKSFFPEEHPQFVGIYWGSVSTPGCEEVVKDADVILSAGPMYTDYTTVGWSALPTKDRTISIDPNYARLPGADYTGVVLAEFLSALAKKVRKNGATLLQYQNELVTRISPAQADMNAPLTRVEMVRQIQKDLDAETTLLVESGDSWFNGEYMHLPNGARFEIEMQWGSIGWSVPATFGYALGLETNRRLISMIGDGSFQLTAQEVANMIHYKLSNITIFLVNNRGYVIESAIHDGPYNYYKNWDYAGLINAWNAEDGHGLGLKATTTGELANAIKRAREHTDGPTLIECQIAHDDYAHEMSDWGKKVSEANSRPPQNP
jgi:pyruvate decarboxylase